jgi:hypothetical protein
LPNLASQELESRTEVLSALYYAVPPQLENHAVDFFAKDKADKVSKMPNRTPV